jgi:hypothetical protein
MNNRIMPDGDIVADNTLRTLIQSMHNRSILNIHLVADDNTVYIASQHTTVPHGTIVPHSNIANHNSSLGKKTILAHLRGKTSYFSYYSHKYIYILRKLTQKKSFFAAS